jgi:uncharacterized protein (TIGR02598 family)
MKHLFSHPQIFHPVYFSKTRRGFSLVEVTIALGITAFAVTAMLGMLPVGLGSLRQSANDMAKAQILKSIGAQLVVADSGTLFGASATPIEAWFDFEGQPVAQSKDPHYYVLATRTNTIFPGDANAADLPSSLRTFGIEIEDLRAHTETKTSLNVANSGL